MTHSNNLIEIGFVREAHGLHGHVVVHAYSRRAESLDGYGDLYNADRSKAYSLEIINAKGLDFLCKIAGLDDRNSAEAMRGTKFFVPAEKLPPTAEDEYYVRDLIGLAAQDTAGTVLGKIVDVMDLGAHQALEIDFIHNGEISLPDPQRELLLFTNDNVPTVDIIAGLVTINIPAGLLDIVDKP